MNMNLAHLIFINKKNIYTDDFAIYDTINYITKLDDKNIFYYGNWPPTKEAAIKLFQNLRIYNFENIISQQVWHFWITFMTATDINFINNFSNSIALIFAPIFPVCFATHTDSTCFHTHFVISSTSCVPKHPPLTPRLFAQYLETIQKISFEKFNISITIIPKKRAAINKLSPQVTRYMRLPVGGENYV